MITHKITRVDRKPTSTPKLMRIKQGEEIVIIGKEGHVIITGSRAGTLWSLDKDAPSYTDESLYEILPIGTQVTLTVE